MMHWKSMLSSKRSRPYVLVDVSLILSAFFALMLCILLLSLVSAGVGFSVAPMGEDIGWVDLLQRGEGAGTARLFWAIDHRNPFSPWWYIAAKQLILGTDNGLLILRYASALLLALSTYAAIIATSGRPARLFALSLGMCVAVFMANRYADQIYWNFLGALSASLLSVATFAAALERTRYSTILYGLSILFYFIAFATYTIQCGAVVAMVYLALRRSAAASKHEGTTRLLVARATQAILAVLPHLALFGLFFLTWQTTMSPSAVEAFRLELSAGRLLASIREGFWNSDFRFFWFLLASSPYRHAYMVVAIALGGLALWIMRQLGKRATTAHPEESLSAWPIIDFLVVVAALALPTILVETGSGSWTPGTRWPMIYQLSIPTVFVGLPLLLVVTTARSHELRLNATSALTAAVIAVGVLFSLAHNRLQNDISRFERSVREATLQVIAEEQLLGRTAPLQFLFMMPRVANWRSADTISPTIARVWFRQPDVSFRLVPWNASPASVFDGWWPISFGSDAEGVRNAKVWGGTVPYSDLRVLKFDHGSAARLSQLTKEDFAERYINWQRSDPVVLPEIDYSKLCPLHWSAEQPVVGRGWGEPERNPQWQNFRWTVDRSATLSFPNSCKRPNTVRIKVVGAVSEDNLMGLKLKLNGNVLASRMHRTPDGLITYEAIVPSAVPLSGPLLNLTLEVPRLYSAPKDPRHFGAAIGSVSLSTE